MLKKLLSSVFICVTVYETTKGDTAGTSCKTSYECGKGFCCRDATNKVLSSNPQFIGIQGSSTGTCVVGKAAKGEVCDTDCQCDTGLMCYRPMSGVCCPPRTCHDSAYVIKQQEYWKNCLSNPKCAIPPTTTGTSCKTSYECGKGFCCRDAQNKILSSHPRLKGSNLGTCVIGKATKGEACDTDCQCDTGLTCYRPMSGYCCPQKTCHESAYVIKQQEYWRNCLSNPKCSFPK